MKFWNTDICLTSRKSVMVIIGLLISGAVIASIITAEEKTVVEVSTDETDMWIPTEEDIAYQDSMYTIIQNTQDDITEIKEDIVYILERLDYADGSWDSIRYVKGGKIDKVRNK
jgi:hypothetical protein